MMDHPEICSAADEMISHCSSVIAWKCVMFQQGSLTADGRRAEEIWSLSRMSKPLTEAGCCRRF